MLYCRRREFKSTYWEIRDEDKENTILSTWNARWTCKSRGHTYAADTLIEKTITSRVTTRSNRASCIRYRRGTAIETFCVWVPNNAWKEGNIKYKIVRRPYSVPSNMLVDDKGNVRLIPIKPPRQSLQVWVVSRQGLLCKDEQTGVSEQFTEFINGATCKPIQVVRTCIRPVNKFKNAFVQQ